VEALALLTGMEMDLRSWQVRDEEELIHYCYHVAGVVGLMMCRVMGVHDPAAMKHAVDLGIAMQLTNIARDVGEDWSIGRSYLPKSWTDLGLPEQVGTLPKASNADRSNALSNENVQASVERIVRSAEGYYRSGLAGLSYLPSSCRPAICLAAKVYREIGREILRRESRVMDGRISISPARIAWIASIVWMGNIVQAVAVRSFGTSLFNKFLKFSSNSFTGDVAMNDARHLAYLGLSLTSFMASSLFVMVSINPKDPSYSVLPIAYAIGSLIVGIVTNVLAMRAARTPIPVPVHVSR
jgi:phytoene synthase